MSMNGSDVQNKVAARLTLDISPAQQQLKLLADSIKSTLGDSSVATSAQKVNDQIYNSEKMQEERLRQLRLNGSSQRLLTFMAANQQLEHEQTAFQQKMYQQEQLFQEKMNKLQSTATSSGASSSGVMGALGDLFSPSHMVGVAGGIALYHMMDALAQIPASALAAQQSMTKLEQVLELSPSQADIQRYGSLNGMLQQLQQTAGVMATTYGVDLNTVIDAMSMVGRRFKDVGDIVVATDSALQLFAVDGVPVEDAVTGMEAIMAQFNLTTSEARKTMFDITAAAHAFQVTGSDLVDAITRSGSAFHTMKMNSDEAVAAIATLSQMTAQTGGVIGNAWKSIENTLGSDKAVKAMKELGVQVYDANGNIKDSVGLLQSLQAIWPKLSDAAKNHFASVLAGGKFQYGRLETFLNDYSDQYQRALKVMQDANAKQQEELVASALGSPTKQLQMTKASFEVLATTIMQQATPALVQFLTEIRNGTGWINDHWKSLEHWLSIGAKLAEGYVLWKVGVTAYNAALNTALGTQLRFAAGTASIVAESQGFVAGVGAMGRAVMGFTGTVAASLGKMAGFLALFQVISSNINDIGKSPIDKQIGNIQNELTNLDSLQQGDQYQVSAGNLLKNGLGPVYDWFHDGFNFRQAYQDSKSRYTDEGYSNDQLQQRKTYLQGQLKKLQDQKDKQQADEIQKQLDAINAQVAKSMTQATGSTYGPQYLGPYDPTLAKFGGIGVDTGSGGGGGNKQSQAMQAYLDKFSKLTQSDDQGLQYYADRINNASYALDRMNQSFTNANDALKSHEADTKAAADAVKAYNDDVKALNDHANALAGENWQLQQEVDGVSKKMKQVDADYKAGKIDAQTHSDAIYQLTQEYERLTQTLNDNTQAIQKDKDAIAQATADITSTITDMLQTAYQDQQKIQEQALQNIYQPEIDALNAKKDAIDANIQSLQTMWSMQSEQNNLSDLQNQLSGVMADKRYQVVNADGSISWTYDTAKAADLQKQIADQQTKIQHDAQIQQLQDQKNALDQQITNLQNAYNDAKKQLDDYWSYKLQQDQLNQDASNLILKNGMAGALQIVQNYSGQIISQYQAMQQAAAQAGAAIAGGLGGGRVPMGGATSSGAVTSGSSKTAPNGQKYTIWSDVSHQYYYGDNFTQTAKAAGVYWQDNKWIKMKTGGMIPSNIGIPGVDSVPTLLSPSEIVVPSWEDLLKGYSKVAGGGTTININGPLSFPNITKPSDGELFLESLTEKVGVTRVS